MASRLNILLYSGVGAAPGSIQHTLATLKAFVGGRYSILLVDTHLLLSEPWETSTILLVIPGGRDLPLHQQLGIKGAHRIHQYVQQGGRYLGICSGAYFASSYIEFEKNHPQYHIEGERHTQLFQGIARGSVYPGFQYNSENGAKIARVLMPSLFPTHPIDLYFNGGCYFDLMSLSVSQREEIAVLGVYLDPPVHLQPQQLPAVIECQVGSGKALLSGVHFEFDSNLLGHHPNATLLQKLELSDPFRIPLVRYLLGERLGLELISPQEPTLSDALALPSFNLLSKCPLLFCNLKGIPPVALNLSSEETNESYQFLQDEMNTFYIQESNALGQNLPPLDNHKDIEFHWLLSKLTSLANQPEEEQGYFNMHTWGEVLCNNRSQMKHMQWSAGNYLLWGRVVSSTHSLLEKNPSFCNALPSGTTFVGYYQTQGRGRGGNTWISPSGCLQFSVLMKCGTKSGSSLPYLNPSTAVFVQYLMGLAIVTTTFGKTLNLRLKWPNDIYVADGTKKVGGILVSSSMIGNSMNIVLSCGLNISNSIPTVCVNELLTRSGHPTITMEEALAQSLYQLDQLWIQFLNTGAFSGTLLDLYYQHWLHSGQEVRLGDQGNLRARITGLDQYGYLQAVSLDKDSQLYTLQPDGNSFDMMRGLIYRKVK
jgi:biotin--protein ligase